MPALRVGSKAPDFKLTDAQRSAVSLSGLLKDGKHIVLAFYPAAWSGVCGDELTLFQESLDELERLNARVVGISVDNFWSNAAFAENRGITFPLLSDFHPKGAVAEKYGVMRDDGVTERALFVIDRDGTIRYSYVSPIGENPGVGRILDALEGMGEGGA